MKTLNEIYQNLYNEKDIEDSEQSLWDMAQKLYKEQNAKYYKKRKAQARDSAIEWQYSVGEKIII